MFYIQLSLDDVSHTEPFTTKDLHIRSLSQLVNDQERWTYLYPDKTKEETFGKYANEGRIFSH